MDYAAFVNDAKAKFAALQRERVAAVERVRAIDIELTALGQAINALARMVPKQESGFWEFLRELGELIALDAGMTEQVRRFFAANSTAEFSAADVRQHLQFSGFDLAKYSNALAAIHMVLKRLESQGELSARQRDDGTTVYQWKQKTGFFAAAVPMLGSLGALPPPAPTNQLLHRTAKRAIKRRLNRPHPKVGDQQ